MTNHPNRGVKFYCCCPRGFANEIGYWRVMPADRAEVQARIDLYADSTSGYAMWIDPTPAQRWRAIEWADRQFTTQPG